MNKKTKSTLEINKTSYLTLHKLNKMETSNSIKWNDWLLMNYPEIDLMAKELFTIMWAVDVDEDAAPINKDITFEFNPQWEAHLEAKPIISIEQCEGASHLGWTERWTEINVDDWDVTELVIYNEGEEIDCFSKVVLDELNKQF